MSSAGNEIEVEGASGVSIEEVVFNQSTTLGQHSDLLANLSSSNSAFYQQLSKRVNQLTARPSVSPSVPNPVVPVSSDREPPVPFPE